MELHFAFGGDGLEQLKIGRVNAPLAVEEKESSGN
jgi:hypothetical protein